MKTKTINYLLSFVLALWASALSAQSHWSVNPEDFQHDMTVYYELRLNGTAVPFAESGNYEVAAFVGDECRGVGEILSQTIADNTIHYGYLRIWSNMEGGETVTFKAYIKDTDQEVLVDEDADMPFVTPQAIAYPSKPKVLNVSKVALTLDVDASKGTVSGGGDYYRGVQAAVTATPAAGYEFAKWSDESTDNPHTVTMNAPLTLSAIFTPIAYTIECDLAGGSVLTPNVTEYNVESDGFTLTNPTREGYTFLGWTGTGLTGSVKDVTVAKGSTGDRSYTAQWQAEEYNISYNLNEGSVLTPNPATYTIESETFTLNNPTREGYTFAGWTGTGISSGANATVTIVKGSTGNRSYSAMWLVGEASTISYDLAGGTLQEGDANPAAYNVETETFTLKNPVREGYTFAGWTGTGLSGASQTVTVEKGKTGNLSFTATWAINQYTMTFVLDNGEPPVVTKQDFGTALPAPAGLTKTGFTFKGWSTDVPSTVPNQDMTFTAQWERNSYKLTWIVDDNSTESMVPYDATIVKPEDPVKTGYTFKGWTPVVQDRMPAVDVTYTALFEPRQYTVTFLFGGSGQASVVLTQDYGSPLAAPEVNDWAGYAFAGWDSEVPSTVPAADKTFTAQWTAVQYTITCNLQGGTVATDNPTSYTIESAPITLNNPTRSGYDFAGWIGSGLTGVTKTVVIPQGSMGDLMFTAQWTPMPAGKRGDVNGDDKINGMDIVEMVSLVMSNGYKLAADLYPVDEPDGKLNGMDLVTLVDIVMSQPATSGARPDRP